MGNDSLDDYLFVEEIATKLGVTPTKIHELASSSKIDLFACIRRATFFEVDICPASEDFPHQQIHAIETDWEEKQYKKVSPSEINIAFRSGSDLKGEYLFCEHANCYYGNIDPGEYKLSHLYLAKLDEDKLKILLKEISNDSNKLKFLIGKDDYTHLEINGEKFNFNDTQAKIIQTLYVFYLEGEDKEGIKQSLIFKKSGVLGAARMHSTFRALKIKNKFDIIFETMGGTRYRLAI